MSFRSVPKSVTLNDLEWRNGRYFALFQRTRVASGALRKSSCSLSHILMSSCITRATLASAGVSCRHVSVCPSVTSRCSTEMAKRRITQTSPHDRPGTAEYLDKTQNEVTPTEAPNASGVSVR